MTTLNSVKIDPIVTMVNATLESFLREFESLKLDKPFDIPEASFVGTLRLLEGENLAQHFPLYDGKERNASWLSELLSPFQDTLHSVDIEPRFNALCSLLPYLTLLEEGGLKKVNDDLAKLLCMISTLKVIEEHEGKAGSYEASLTFCKAFNDRFYAAIFLFPHLAQSIKVVVKPKPFTDSEQHSPWSYINGADRRRHLLAKQVDAYSPEARDGETYTFYLPLPYGLISAEPDGPRESLVQRGVQETLYFKETSVELNDPIYPALMLALEGGYAVTPFGWDEIVSIEFAGPHPFTPRLYEEERRGERAREPYVLHYLMFRWFRPYYGAVKREELPKMTDEEWELLRESVYDPAMHTNLQYPMFDMHRAKSWYVGLHTVQTPYNLIRTVARRGCASPDLESLKLALQLYRSNGRPMPKHLEFEGYVGIGAIEHLMGIPIPAHRP